MIPKYESPVLSGFKVIERPSRTYRIDWENKRVIGTVGGKEAVEQAVRHILGTERYDNLIYSWNYGIELKDLYGHSVPFVKSELKRRIKEALMQDDRVRSVDAFSFAQKGRRMTVSFVVHTTFGDSVEEVELNV